MGVGGKTYVVKSRPIMPIRDDLDSRIRSFLNTGIRRYRDASPAELAGTLLGDRGP